jgi:transposase
MWHFATEGDNFKAILEEQGFEHRRVDMENELADDDPLRDIYDQGDAGRPALREWQPPELDGWKLIAKNDTEDGIVAHYIRALSPTAPASTPRTAES